MNISLGTEFEKRINEKVASGLYSSASEVIREGLRLLFEKDIQKQQQLEILKEAVGKGFRQLDDGISSQKSVLEIFNDVSKEVNDNL
jgi:antitoxin ParD1/3/4